MKRKLFLALALIGSFSSFSQDACSFGTVSDQTGIGENISTGGAFEYRGAADFTVPFGTTYTANQITVNVMKGPAAFGYVNVAFRHGDEGFPGDIIETFDNLTPTSEVLVYNVEGESFSVYTITLDLPEAVIFEKGTYFLEMSANPTDENGAWWEVTAQEQTFGNFDYVKFEDEPWGGAGYYNKVFQVIGTCAPSGEEHPDYGDDCSQGNFSLLHENGVPFIVAGGVVSVADDFTVAENTTFHLTHFNMSTLLLGGGLTNATINIRTSEGGAPGQIVQSFTNKGPAYERYNGYWPFPGSPFDVASIVIDFSFENEPVTLGAGTYFIEVIPTPNAAEFLTWELTSGGGLGGNSYTSYDGGSTWDANQGVNQIFSVSGYCEQNLGTDSPDQSAVGYYPNPVTDVLHLTAALPIEKMTLYDLEGRKIREYANPSENINLEGLSQGMYVAVVNLSDGSVSNLKIIKK
ncbi:T9SS type A sorting domain-containing protein [Flavobacterium sp. MAH-1]|uniref:T9SS type A sorting domain-containing protein n=1 Tax=Flavobacterium agri TaxID=2743471 RepID=A0A7Y8Y4Q7_9FLAO|nr:T9SS type A sorting domain-containing protein [Flavobacterium agri]NUY82494.1 T9SS type A sorting domain-containing protein [Flavobacterium agri]NYA72518.1 T9SS type A sorting domain-containing protein [Flavobacterium agri]